MIPRTCKCGHNRKAHESDNECFFSYNCDCKRYEPVPLPPADEEPAPVSTSSATCIVDATQLFSTSHPDNDNYAESPVIGYLVLTMVQKGRRDVRTFALTKSEGMTPYNMSSYVHQFVFDCMGWKLEEKCGKEEYPDYHLGDRFVNSGGGLDNYCHEGKLIKFELDTDRLSPTFGKIFP